MAGAIGTIGTAHSVSKEGGDFTAGLGKIVERMVGVPRGTIGAGPTEAEKKRAMSI
jgi:hypothetical protein